MPITYLDEEPVAQASPQPERKVTYLDDKPVFDLSDTLESAYHAVKDLGVTVPAAFYRAKEGLARPDTYSDAAKRAIAAEQELLQQRQQEREQKILSGDTSTISEALEAGGQSLGFGIGSMAPQALAGAGAGAAYGSMGGPGGAAAGSAIGAAAGMLAGGASAYRMAGNQFLSDSFQQFEQKSLQENGRPLSEDEKSQLYSHLLPIAQNTALWEAGPEAVANAVTMGAGKFIFGFGKKGVEKIAGNALATAGKKVAAGAGDLASELGTEALTQQHQGYDQAKVDAMLQGRAPETAIDEYSGMTGFGKALGEVTPAVLGQMALMGGAAGAVKMGQKTLGKTTEPRVSEGTTIEEYEPTEEEMAPPELLQPAPPAPEIEAMKGVAQQNAAAGNVATAAALQQAGSQIHASNEAARVEKAIEDAQKAQEQMAADAEAAQKAEAESLKQASRGANAPDPTQPEAIQATDNLQKYLKTKSPGMLNVMEGNAKDMVKNGFWVDFTGPDGKYDEDKMEAYRVLLNRMGRDIGDIRINRRSGTATAKLKNIEPPTTQENANPVQGSVEQVRVGPEAQAPAAQVAEGVPGQLQQAAGAQAPAGETEVQRRLRESQQAAARPGPGGQAVETPAAGQGQEAQAGGKAREDALAKLPGLAAQIKSISKPATEGGPKYAVEPEDEPTAKHPFTYRMHALLSEGKFNKLPISSDGTIPRKAWDAEKGPGNSLSIPKYEKALYESLVPEAFTGDRVNVKMLDEKLRDLPGVEVHTYGQHEEESESKKELDKMTHEWMDNLSDKASEYVTEFLFSHDEVELKQLTKKLKRLGVDMDKVEKFRELTEQVEIERGSSKSEGPRATGAYNQVSPLDTTKHPVKRIDVVLNRNEKRYSWEEWQAGEMNKPNRKIVNTDTDGGTGIDDLLWPADNTHEQLPNTLGWAMVQEVTHNGEKKWLIGELQSRWGQEMARMKKQQSEAVQKNPKSDAHIAKFEHPLLSSWESLVLKSVLDQARRAGVKKVVLSDGETAMMTEGHDKATEQNIGQFKSEKEAKDFAAKNGGRVVEAMNDGTVPREWVVYKPVVEQESGMRAQYDKRGPDILRKLTGDSGQPVDLGVHKNAAETERTAELVNGQMENVDRMGRVVGSPVFRTPEGKPKTNITGREYTVPEDSKKVHYAGEKEEDSIPPVAGSRRGRENILEGFGSQHEDEEHVPWTDQEVTEWLRAKEEADPDYVTKRIERALERPGEVRSTDVDVAMKRWRDLEKANQRLYPKINDRKLSDAYRNDLIRELEKNEAEQSKALLVAQRSLSSFGLGLRSGRKMFGDDFSTEGLTARLGKGHDAFIKKLQAENRRLKGLLAEKATAKVQEAKPGVFHVYKKATKGISSRWGRVLPDDRPDPTGKGKSVADVRKMLEDRGITENPYIKIGNFGKEQGRNWSMKVEDGKIVINASQIKDAEHFRARFEHELGHMASKDREVVKHWNLLKKALTTEEKKALSDWVSRYEESEKADEERAEILRMLGRRPSAKAKLDSFVAKVQRVLKKVTGINFSKPDAERIAAEAIARAEGGIKEKAAAYAVEKGAKYAGEKDQSTDKSSEEDMFEFNAAQENSLMAENNFQAAVDRAAYLSAAKHDTMEGFFKGVYELLGKHEKFKEATKEDIDEALVEAGMNRFATRPKLVRDINKLLSKKADTKEKTELDKINAKIEKLKKRLAEGNFVKQTKKYKILTEEEHEAKLKLDDLRRELYGKEQEERRKHRPLLKVATDGLADTANLARSVMTGMDLSAVLRQGILPTLANPARSLRILPKMFAAMRSEENQNKVMREIRSRPNAQWYEAGGLFLKDPTETKPSSMEEAFMSRFAAKWPRALGGGLIRGSERAYVTFLNRLRADVFDTMAASLPHPEGTMTVEEAKALANAANVFTGRGKIGLSDKTSAGLNTWLFAPKYVASIFNTMFGQPLYQGNIHTRKAVAKEYAKFLTSVGLLYGLASMTLGDDDSIETDPRSSDFGKIKYGNVRLNPLGGLLQNTTLLSRIGTGESKTIGGDVRELRGDNKSYGGQSVPGVIGNYLRMKLAPVPAAALNIASGTNPVGEPTDAATEALRLVTPMSGRDIADAMEADGVPKKTALAILALFGMGVNSFERTGSTR